MTFDSMHEFNLSRMKQKTAKKLEMLVNEYKETTGPARVARVGKRQIGTPLLGLVRQGLKEGGPAYVREIFK